MLTESSTGLYCPGGDFHIDPWGPADRALITHAHGDHARPGSKTYLCAAPSKSLLERRLGTDASLPKRRVNSGAHGAAQRYARLPGRA